MLRDLLVRAVAAAAAVARAGGCLAVLLAVTAPAGAQPSEREIEPAALYMPNLGAQPGQRLKTRTTIGCFRHATDDYRCIILGLRMQAALVVSPDVDEAAQAYLERYCRGRKSGLDYQECRFKLSFDFVSESFDAAESMRVYRAKNMQLDSDYLRLKRSPPNRSDGSFVSQDRRVTGSIGDEPAQRREPSGRAVASLKRQKAKGVANRTRGRSLARSG